MYGNDARQDKYVVPDQSILLSLEKAVLERLAIIKDIVAAQGINREKVDSRSTIPIASHPLLAYLIEKTVLCGMAVAEYLGGVNYFYSDSRCTGCGICARVCLAAKIKMTDRRPVWQKNVLCYMCFACLNYCPRAAVQIHDIPGVKSLSGENGRYPHPYATIHDIAAQKEIRIP